MSRSAALALAAAAALGVAVFAAPALGLELGDWDIDGDGAISHREFRVGMGMLGVYQRWDSDHDGMLTDEEFRARPPAVIEEQGADFWDVWGFGGEPVEEAEFERRAFEAFDRDGDGLLDESEWSAFVRHASAQGWAAE